MHVGLIRIDHRERENRTVKEAWRERERRGGHGSTRCRREKVQPYGAVGPLGLLKRLSHGLAADGFGRSHSKNNNYECWRNESIQ